MNGPLLELNNGVEMPALGFGVFQTPPEETAGAVATALQTGYRLIDTAAAYMNESGVGEAVHRSGLDRSDVFIETKVWISDFGYNEKLEPSFMSRPDTKHVKNILKDPRVSVAIYSFPGPEGGNLGLRIKGKAEHVSGQSGTDEAVAYSGTWLRFRTMPEEVWCFDSRVLGGKHQRVDLLDLQLG